MGVSLYLNPEGVMHSFSLLGLSMAVKPSLDEIALVSELLMARRRAVEELLCNCPLPEHPWLPSVRDAVPGQVNCFSDVYPSPIAPSPTQPIAYALSVAFSDALLCKVKSETCGCFGFICLWTAAFRLA